MRYTPYSVHKKQQTTGYRATENKKTHSLLLFHNQRSRQQGSDSMKQGNRDKEICNRATENMQTGNDGTGNMK